MEAVPRAEAVRREAFDSDSSVDGNSLAITQVTIDPTKLPKIAKIIVQLKLVAMPSVIMFAIEC